VDLARRYGARVIVVTAYEPLPRDLGSPYLDELMAKRLAAAEALAREAAGPLQMQGVPHSVEILEGPAARAILDVSRVRNCDLIVMGSRGLGPLGAALLGSVSLKVVQEASCPVLITR